jgi:hypothetical protein
LSHPLHHYSASYLNNDRLDEPQAFTHRDHRWRYRQPWPRNWPPKLSSHHLHHLWIAQLIREIGAGIGFTSNGHRASGSNLQVCMRGTGLLLCLAAQWGRDVWLLDVWLVRPGWMRRRQSLELIYLLVWNRALCIGRIYRIFLWAVFLVVQKSVRSSRNV